MKKYDETELLDDQMNGLEDELQELLEKAENVLGYKPDDINQVVEDLLSKNTEESIAIATCIMDIEEDMIVTEEYYIDENETSDDPYSNLYDQDSE